MWLAVVPLAIIGFFLLITWEALSPVKFVRQHKAMRAQRRRDYEEMVKNDKFDD